MLHNFGQCSSFHSKSLQTCTHFFVSIHAWCLLDLDWMHSPTIVLKHVEALSCCNALISYLIIWITFKYLSCRLVGISHWLLCNILDEIWSFELIIFKGIHICICHMSVIGNGNTHKVLIGCLSRPIDSNAPGIQLAMWLGQMKIFRTMLWHYVSKLLLYSICNYVASTAYRGTVFTFWVSLLVNFMYFYCFRVFHREVPVANIVSIFHITGIRNYLNTKRLLPIMHYLMPVVQLYLFLAQWRLVLLWKCCLVHVSCMSPSNVSSYYYLLLSLLPWQWFSFTLTLYHKIHELFYLWCQTNLKLQENCAINAQAANHLKTAVIVTFLARSLALHRTAEPQEALWQ